MNWFNSIKRGIKQKCLIGVLDFFFLMLVANILRRIFIMAWLGWFIMACFVLVFLIASDNKICLIAGWFSKIGLDVFILSS